MIVQEDVPYTKEEVKAMVKTIHDLREKVGHLGWHPASEPPSEDGLYYCLWGMNPFYAEYKDGKWTCIQHDNWADIKVKYWCYPPKEE